MPATPPPLPPIRADLTAEGLRCDEDRLRAALAVLPPEAPVVAMVHGFRFRPGIPRHCPHGHILSLDPPQGDRTAISWPRHLGLDGRRGLAIGFGWDARATLWTAHARATRAGAALAELAALLRRIAPQRRLQVIAHSLGARVALAALQRAAPGDIARLVLLAAAEARETAQAAMASPAGRLAEVINVTTRENDLFDFLFEWLILAGGDTALGQGLGLDLPNWRDLRIDQPGTLAVLARLGHALPPPRGRVSHWSPYLRPGAFGLYRALLDGSLPAGALPAAREDRRWSRLFRLPRLLPERRDIPGNLL